MSCLEHLIGNCLYNFEKGKSIEEIEKAIEDDINLEYAGITDDQCWEICQYVWYRYILPLKEEAKRLKELTGDEN